LWLPSVDASYVLCNVLGLKVVTDNNTSNITVELKSTQSISLNVLKALSISPRWSHITNEIDSLIKTTLSNQIINHFQTSDAFSDWIINRQNIDIEI
jgi:hypothetical protein